MARIDRQRARIEEIQAGLQSVASGELSEAKGDLRAARSESGASARDLNQAAAAALGSVTSVFEGAEHDAQAAVKGIRGVGAAIAGGFRKFDAWGFRTEARMDAAVARWLSKAATRWESSADHAWKVAGEDRSRATADFGLAHERFDGARQQEHLAGSAYHASIVELASSAEGVGHAGRHLAAAAGNLTLAVAQTDAAAVAEVSKFATQLGLAAAVAADDGLKGGEELAVLGAEAFARAANAVAVPGQDHLEVSVKTDLKDLQRRLDALRSKNPHLADVIAEAQAAM